MSYPVTFEADYVERPQPADRVLPPDPRDPAGDLGVRSTGSSPAIAVVIAWFAIVITGRYPEGLYDFVADFTRFLTRVIAYARCCATPTRPSAAPTTRPIRCACSSTGRSSTTAALKTLLPHHPRDPDRDPALRDAACCWRSARVAAWFVILVTGKMPRGLFDLMVLANSYTARSDAYLFLLTETYPPFQDEQTRAAGTVELTDAPAPTPPGAPPPRTSRAHPRRRRPRAPS